MIISSRTQSLIDFDNQLFLQNMGHIFETFEFVMANNYLASAISTLQAKTEHKDNQHEYGNRVTLMLVDGQISGYAEKYDEILRSMRHYG